jgi:hypothetical protein
MFGLSRGVTLGIAAAIVILVLLLVGPAACNAIRSKGAQVRLQGEQIEALGNSAKDAIATQGAAGDRERASEELSRTNEEEIRNADGASEVVKPGVRDAGRRSLCRRASHRHKPECRGLLGPGAAGVEAGGGERRPSE